ncbi:hypothetical protein IAR55_000424 [Kwoniella newhampshirensis]|uniref:Uncharacterized protein n=1 Tax=Kwoniella newhampshirensis TaxID=1651941 RepID=A0AAW0Z6K7_9TREE
MPDSPPSYLSSQSANALISDLRPTSFSLTSLHHLNALLDELLVSLITAAQSINPYDLRREGIPSVFSSSTGGEPGEKAIVGTAGESTGVKALGRSATAEAEVELRSWQEGRTKGVKGFPPDGKGNGTRVERTFPLVQAVELMRLKCVALSTLASQDLIDEAREERVISEWKRAGGDIFDDTIEPAGLWITSIIEHVCEHVLSQVARVVARDSGIVVASPQHLYTALCEDESVWGFFKRMKVKEDLESAIRSTSRSKRSTPTRASADLRTGGRSSPVVDIRSSPVHRDAAPATASGVPTSPSIAFDNARTSVETTRTGGIAGGVVRKPSNLSKKISPAKNLLHSYAQAGSQNSERSGSVLSVNTRSVLGVFNNTYGSEDGDEGQSPQEAQDEFDALVKSGETMRVSLTPSRLRTFETAGGRRRQPPESPVERLASRSQAGSTRSERSQSMAHNKATPIPALPDTTEFFARSTPPRTGTTSPSNNSPSSNVEDRNRSNSAQKRLLARPAATIDEKTDEGSDKGSGRVGGQKQSLMELLATEDAFGPLPPESSESSRRSPKAPMERTVPAVVLGTPPPAAPRHRVQSPPRSPPSTSSPPSLNRPSRSRGHSAEGADGLTFSNVAASPDNGKKSEIQEMADFFNSTAPPPPPPSSWKEDDTLLTGKSGKGFRSFVMARVKGSKKSLKDKEEERYHTPLTNSGSHTRLNSLNAILPRSDSNSNLSGNFKQLFVDDTDTESTKLQKPRKQKSTHSFATRSKPAISSFGDESSPATVNRDLSDSSHPVTPKEGTEDILSATVALGSILGPIGADQQMPVPDQPAASGDEVSGSEQGHPNLAASATSSDPLFPSQLGPNLNPSRSQAQRTPTAQTMNHEDPQDVGEKAVGTPSPRHIPTSSSPTPDRPSLVSATSEAASFMTADEGDVSDVEEIETDDQARVTDKASMTSESVSGTGTTLPAASQHPEGAKVEPKFVVGERTEPSILLRDLIPLRNLLDHATSARESRLLLSAILTQYGVPQADDERGQVQPSAEDRASAWLLAGREGPVPVPVVPNSREGILLEKETDRRNTTPTQETVSTFPDPALDHQCIIPQSVDSSLKSDLHGGGRDGLATTSPHTPISGRMSEGGGGGGGGGVGGGGGGGGGGEESEDGGVTTDTDTEEGVVVGGYEGQRQSPIRIVRG